MAIDNPILVTGVNGQLGHDVIFELLKRGLPCVSSDITSKYSGTDDNPRITDVAYIQMDITNQCDVELVFSEIHPSAVIHCAAWTAVDAAEDFVNIEKVFKINALGTKLIADACKQYECKMMYISTDYVFNGLGVDPWKPDCKEFNPLNIYGKSKLEGERAVASTLEDFFIVRIAWVFGKNGSNFVKTMLKLSEKYESLRVVDDQIGTPTYTVDLSRLVVDMIQSDKFGYYHATNEGGYISWADFAKEIMFQTGKSTKIIPVSTVEYGLSKAKRPYNSRLDKSKLQEQGFSLLPDWKNALSRYLKEMKDGTN